MSLYVWLIHNTNSEHLLDSVNALYPTCVFKCCYFGLCCQLLHEEAVQWTQVL